MSNDTLYPYAKARQAALALIEQLRPACYHIEIAGSIRRVRPQVHDIDLVAWPIYHDEVSANLFGETTQIKSRPDQLLSALGYTTGQAVAVDVDAKILKTVSVGIPVEIYLVERDGSNAGALLQMRTGPAAHNAWLAARAQRMHLSYRAGYGIYRLGEDCRFTKRVDDGSETGIYQALGLPYPQPDQRG